MTETPNGEELAETRAADREDRAVRADDRAVRADRTVRAYDAVRTLAVVVLVLVVAAGDVAILLLSIGAAHQRDELTRIAERVQSCTDPGQAASPGHPARPPGKCFADSAKRQAGVIGEPAGPINTVVSLAAACAAAVVDDGDTETAAIAKTDSCTRRALAATQHAQSRRAH